MRHPVPIIVLAQLFGTSLWFSANSAADDLVRQWGISAADIGVLTNAVQLGFIVGTLIFAISGLADRFAASRIFAVCAVAGAAANAAFALLATGMSAGVPLRFIVRLCLAGVYPLGMQLIVSWVPERAGSALALQNAIGFAITMVSIHLGTAWIGTWQSDIAWLLLPGPLLGLLGLAPLWRRRHLS